MSDTQAQAKTTGYEGLADGSNFVRELIPARTECTLHVKGFALDVPEGGLAKANVVGRFEVVGPEELEDYGTFLQRFYLGNTPKEGKSASQTAWTISARQWFQIIAAILNAPIKDQEVRTFFADALAEHDPASDLAGYYDAVVARLNTLTGQVFNTRIGVEVDRKGQYDPKQTVGKPIFPSEAEAAQAAA